MMSVKSSLDLKIFFYILSSYFIIRVGIAYRYKISFMDSVSIRTIDVQ